VAAEDFEQARDKIIMGIERDEVLTDEEKERIAYHEAGHALMAAMTPNADPLQKVSIIPRGGRWEPPSKPPRGNAIPCKSPIS
jgi:cell division protease FtsH